MSSSLRSVSFSMMQCVKKDELNKRLTLLPFRVVVSERRGVGKKV